MHPAPGLGPQPDGGRRTVGHQHRHGQHRDLADALLLQDVVLAEQGEGAADAGADHDADPFRIEFG